LISLKLQFNARFTPACRIPPEILSLISEHLGLMQMERIRPLSRNPAVTQVCDFWRATAMKTPCLWNQMSSDDEVSLRFYHRFQFPVHVHWSDESRPSKRKTQSAMDFDADPRGFSQIFENPARILSIDIFAHQMETIRTCLARMDGDPAPLLTSLNLFTDPEPTTDRHVPELEALLSKYEVVAL
jgi:hypothetical protein